MPKSVYLSYAFNHAVAFGFKLVGFYCRSPAADIRQLSVWEVEVEGGAGIQKSPIGSMQHQYKNNTSSTKNSRTALAQSCKTPVFERELGYLTCHCYCNESSSF